MTARVHRIAINLDAAGNKYVRVTFLASNSLVVGQAMLDLATFRQAVAGLWNEEPYVLECERDEPWQTLGEAAARVVVDAAQRR